MHQIFATIRGMFMYSIHLFWQSANWKKIARLTLLQVKGTRSGNAAFCRMIASFFFTQKEALEILRLLQKKGISCYDFLLVDKLCTSLFLGWRFLPFILHFVQQFCHSGHLLPLTCLLSFISLTIPLNDLCLCLQNEA